VQMRSSTPEPMDSSSVGCPNVTCCARGQKGLGNIVIHDPKRQRYRCKACRRTFSARRGTMFEGLRKPRDLIVIVVTLLSYGCPIQAIVHAFDLDERTVADWRDRAGIHCQKVHQQLIGHNCTRLQQPTTCAGRWQPNPRALSLRTAPLSAGRWHPGRQRPHRHASRGVPPGKHRRCHSMDQ